MSENPTAIRWRRGLELCALLLLAAGLLFPAASRGDDNAVKVLTLPEARRMAAERNRDIRKAMELRNLLEGRYVEERAAALPQLTITADVSRASDQSLAVLAGGIATQDTRQALLGVSQPLYTWGQVTAGIRAAKVGLATADDQLRLFRQAAERDVTAAFYDILLAKELNLIAVQNLDQKARHLDEARKRYGAGVATDYDVLAAEVAVENARPDVIRTENLIRISRERLRFLLGIDRQEVDAKGAMEAGVEPYPEFAQSLDSAWRNRPDLSDLRHRIGVSEELVTIAFAGDKPRLDFKGGVGWKEIELGEIRESGQTWSAGLFVTYPIFDGLRTRGRVAQAKSDARSLRIDEARLLDSIVVETRNAVNQVREAGEIVKALSGTVGQAERLLFMAEKGFEFGVKTRLEVEDAELNVTQAKGNLARGRRDYLVALVTLEFVQGTLGEEGPAAGEQPWAPAGSPVGLVKEVLRGEPRLAR